MEEIYKAISNISDPTVDLAMSQALPTAEVSDQIKLVLTLLHRGNQRAMAGIVRNLHLFPKALQNKILERIKDLEPGIRVVAADDQVQVGLNLTHLIVRSRCYHLAYLLSVQLQKDNVQIQRAASAGLLELAWGLRLGGQVSDPEVASHVRSLGNALAEALSSYHKHHQHIILMASAALVATMRAQLAGMLSDRLATPYAHLRQILPRMDHPLINRALLFYAAISNLRPIIVETLRSRSVTQRLDDILHGSHLLVLAKVRATVRKVAGADYLLPSEAQMNQMDLTLLRRLPRWVTAIHADHGEKAKVLARLVSTDDPLLRLLGMRALMQINDRPADDRLVMLCLDQNPILARIALRHLMLKKWMGLSRLMALLVDSEHPDIRQMAEHYLISIGFDRLWDRWEHLDTRMRVLAGVSLIRSNPNFYRQLSVKLRHPNDRDRLKAVMMVRHLKLASQFRNELSRLLHDDHGCVASAAVMALGPLAKPPRLKSVLVGLMEHPSDRIRSNAIESLQASSDLIGSRKFLQELAMAGAGHRSRANAIVALQTLGDKDVLNRLSIMLGDPRPKHRISAIWVVQKMALRSMRDRLEMIVSSDSEASVRLAAERALSVVHESSFLASTSDQEAVA